MTDTLPAAGRRFSFIQPLYLSFFSKELYQDVGRHWPGVGFSYLLFLLAVAWIPTMIQFHVSFGRFVRNDLPKITAQLPTIHITKGEVQVDPPGRYEIKDPDTGKVFLIIDPSIEALPLDNIPGDVVLLTHTKLIMRQSQSGETKVQDLAAIQEFSMTPADAQRWMQGMAGWAAPVCYPFFVLFSFIYRAVQALIYAAIGVAFAQAAHARLNYQSLIRLSAVAVTPAVLVDALVDLLRVHIPMWWLLCFIIAMFYVHFAVKAMADLEARHSTDAPMAPPPPI